MYRVEYSYAKRFGEDVYWEAEFEKWSGDNYFEAIKCALESLERRFMNPNLFRAIPFTNDGTLDVNSAFYCTADYIRDYFGLI